MKRITGKQFTSVKLELHINKNYVSSPYIRKCI